MVGIKKVACVLGKNHRTVGDIARFCTEEVQQNMRKIGLDQIPTDNKKILWDMIGEAYNQINETPDCILIGHSLPFIRGNSQPLQFEKEIPVYFFSGLPCAILHKTVQLGKELIESGVYNKILVVGADKAYSDRERVFFGTIMGDGVVALLLTDDAESNKLLGSFVSTTIFAPNGENSELEDIAKFRENNALMMRKAILNCMKEADLDEVDYFVTHTSNSTFWDGMAKLLRCSREKFLDQNIRNTGHMNSHDSFYHYTYWCEQGVIKPRDVVMLINPGFGGTQGCTLIKR